MAESGSERTESRIGVTDDSLSRIAVIGSGFSGLVSAYFLAEAGYSVVVHERADSPGGLLRTERFPWGWVEWGANGILNSSEFEGFCDRIGIHLVPVSDSGKRRLIFRGGKPRRWPLSPMETLGVLARLPFLRRTKPRRDESVAEWSRRALGSSAARWLVAPALQGIYAGSPEKMSAKLIFGRFFARRSKKTSPRLRGTVAPKGGMGELIEKTRAYLRSLGVEFHFSSESLRIDGKSPTVIATGLVDARKILKSSSDALRSESASFLDQVEALSLVTVTLAYPSRESSAPEAFGCLFPRGQGIRSLGVLFESEIFADRGGYSGDGRFERWILGGALDVEAPSLSDKDLLDLVLRDREALLGKREIPYEARIVRALDAFPHYDLSLLEALSCGELENLAKDGVLLVGNYTGSIGLSGIFEKAKALPERVEAILKGAATVS